MAGDDCVGGLFDMVGASMSHGEVKQVNGKRVASPEYRSWQMMKNRCLNPKAEDWEYYGGRGIRICKRWRDFDCFLEDMGRRPSTTHTLERKNTDGAYCKSNCKWATRQAQARNRNYAKLSMPLARTIRRAYKNSLGDQYQLAEHFGVSQGAISQVLLCKTWKEGVGR